MVVSSSSTATVVLDGVDHFRELNIYQSNLASAIRDDAVLSCARKGLSFTAVPVVMQVASRAVIACRGKNPIPTSEILKVKKVSSLGASCMARCNAAVAQEKVRGGRSRPACVRGRIWACNRTLELAEVCLQKKAEFLKSCPYLSLTADESDTFSSSAPLSCGLQGCTKDFTWANLFMGQDDVAEDKTGLGCFNAIKRICDKTDKSLLPKVKFSVFDDGASNMRSTPKYAGLDSKPDGTSVHAFLKKHVSAKLPNMHCLNHDGNLAMKQGVKKCKAWTDSWIEHVKGIYRWFCKSHARKSVLKSLHTEMQLLQDTVTWRMLYPKYYCPTRWLGTPLAIFGMRCDYDFLA